MAIVFMIGMIVLDLIPKAAPVAGVFALGAATVTAVRAWHWQIWSVLDQPHLWALGLGYAWLALGLGLKGLTQIFGSLLGLTEALHGITIGALGTLTLIIMARTSLQRSRQGLEYFSDMGMAALLVSLAALLRLSAPLAGSEYTLLFLWASAVAWFFAFSLLLRRLVIIHRKGLRSADNR
jgi:uncharacterized protein involved in response to NO